MLFLQHLHDFNSGMKTVQWDTVTERRKNIHLAQFHPRNADEMEENIDTSGNRGEDFKNNSPYIGDGV